MYATVQDLRDEGVTAAMASDDRLEALLRECSALIDHATGWFFEPRESELWLDGRGHATIVPKYPPIRLDYVSVGGRAVSVARGNLIIEGAPVQPGFSGPRVTLARVVPPGIGNVVLRGVFGYTGQAASGHSLPPFGGRRCSRSTSYSRGGRRRRAAQFPSGRRGTHARPKLVWRPAPVWDSRGRGIGQRNSSLSAPDGLGAT
jgi:hypothetical protein